MIYIYVSGKPQPGGSKRGFNHKHTGRVVIIPDNKKTKPWMDDVAKCARQVCTSLLKSPVAVVCYFDVVRPKSHFNSKGQLKHSAPKRPATRPDGTKLWRSTEDALKGIAWVDDGQVVDQLISKRYAAAPGAHIYIEIASL